MSKVGQENLNDLDAKSQKEDIENMAEDKHVLEQKRRVLK